MVSIIGESHLVLISWEGMRKTRIPIEAARLYFSMSLRNPEGLVCLPLVQTPPSSSMATPLRW